MKRTKSLFALLVAAVLALALVPGMAWGEDSGDLEDPNRNTGTITIVNPKDGETYKVYRLFELASFTDANPRQHVTDSESYSYVIRQFTDANKSTTNPWYTFLTKYGPNGEYNEDANVTDTNYPYAKLSDNNKEGLDDRVYFVIERDAITLDTSLVNNGTYHVVTPTSKFENSGASNLDYTGDNTKRTGSDGTHDAEGNPVGGDLLAGNNAIVQKFAQEALKYATQIIGSDPRISPDVTLPITDGGSTVYSTTQPLGYYLVGTSMGTLASLDTNNRNVDIYEKNDEPGIEKKILKKGGTTPALTSDGLTGSTGWVSNTDADFEDYVLFRTIVTAQQGAKNYKIHDVMENGLALVSTPPTGSVSMNKYVDTGNSGVYAPKVYLVRGSSAYFVPDSVESYTNYALTTSGSDKCDFEIDFNAISVNNYGDDLVELKVQNTAGTDAATFMDIQDGDKIVVLYWAKVVDDVEDVWGREESDENTLMTTVATANNTQLTTQKYYEHDGNGRNDNHTVLTYGDGSYTAWSDASVTTYGFDIAKTKPVNTDGVGASNYAMLDGAHFELYKASKVSGDLVSNGISFTPNAGNTPYYQSSKALSFTAGESNYYSYDGDTSPGSASTVTDLVSKDGKAIELTGLEAGDYLLVETKAPTGYNKLAHPIVVTIAGDADNNGEGNQTSPDGNEGTITYVFSPNSAAGAQTTADCGWQSTIKAAASTIPAYYPTNVKEADNSDPLNPVPAVANGGVHIVNQTGQELPSTGGLGTKAFYAIGGSLFAASVIFLTTKKRLKQAA